MRDIIPIPKGFRFTTLYERASNLRDSGVPEARILKVITYCNTMRCSPPVRPRSIEALVRRVCSQEPMRDKGV